MENISRSGNNQATDALNEEENIIFQFNQLSKRVDSVTARSIGKQ